MSTGDKGRTAADDHELHSLLDALPEGWSVATYRGRRYGVTKIIHGTGRSLSIYAEQLDGSDVISANVYRTRAGDVLKPCEMLPR